MKALSIRQPWAWAILHAGKDIENRDWRTHMRGRVLVHASKAMTPDEYEAALGFMHDLSRTRPFTSGLALPGMKTLPRGVLLGSVEIVDCVKASSSPWFFGTFGFVLRDPQPLPTPIPFIGKLGFFDVPDDIVARAA